MNSELLEKLQCPRTGARLLRKGNFLVTDSSDQPLRYKIESNIPDLLKEHGEQLTASQWKEIMEKE